MARVIDSPTASALDRIERAVSRLEIGARAGGDAPPSAGHLALERRHLALRDQVAGVIARLDELIAESTEAEA